MQFLNPSDKTAAMDYGSALATAVAWLGNRYLLASPARRLTPLERCNAELSAAPAILPRSQPVRDMKKPGQMLMRTNP